MDDFSLPPNSPSWSRPRLKPGHNPQDKRWNGDLFQHNQRQQLYKRAVIPQEEKTILKEEAWWVFSVEQPAPARPHPARRLLGPNE